MYLKKLEIPALYVTIYAREKEKCCFKTRKTATKTEKNDQKHFLRLRENFFGFKKRRFF